MCGWGIPGLLHRWDRSPCYGFSYLGLFMTPLCYAMSHIQISVVILTPLFRFLNWSYPAIMQLHSSISVENTIFRHHSNVQCILNQEFLMFTSSVQNLGVIPLNNLVMFSGILSNGGLLQLQASLCSFSLNSRHWTVFPMYASPHEQATWYTTIDCFSNDSGSFTLVSSEQMVLAPLKAILMSKPLPCNIMDGDSGFEFPILFSLHGYCSLQEPLPYWWSI